MKLKGFHVEDNAIKHLECKFLWTLAELRSLNITINTLESLQKSCFIEDKRIHSNVVILSNDSVSKLRIEDKHFDWILSKNDFNQIRHLNLSGSKMENISSMLEEVSTQLETLDLSIIFVGKLETSTFYNFGNLKRLFLSRSNLSHFQFETFYHLRNLEVLDISYNNLNEIDFYLFIRTFHNLISLNLEGNNLMNIDSLKRSCFPKLTLLGISKNRFSCNYLISIFLEWHDIKFIDNPSNQTHMGGVDCWKQDLSTTTDAISLKNTTNTNNCRENIVSSDKSNDLFAIRILLGLFLFVFTISKCKRTIKKCKEKLMHKTNEQRIIYNEKNGIDMQHERLEPQLIQIV